MTEQKYKSLVKDIFNNKNDYSLEQKVFAPGSKLVFNGRCEVEEEIELFKFDKPGVYLMKNSLGEIIYVGKAKILKNRVKSYFQNSKNHSEKVRVMVKNIAEFEYIVTDTEMEALILECNLIKKYSPKYNILLKDDKFYPFIKITMKDDFPRVFVTRNFAKDGSKYFGPYTNGTAVYETIDLIYKIFPLRTCVNHL